MSANKVFGIDLGTTYSCISHVDRFGRPEVIGNLDGELDDAVGRALRLRRRRRVVGSQAKRQAGISPDHVASAREAPHGRRPMAVPRARARVVGRRPCRR